MGCSSSSAARARSATSVAALRKQRTTILLENMDWDNKPCTRKVKEFEMYSGRLQPIDWRAAIEARVDWKDPNFPTTTDSILDRDIQDRQHHQEWSNFTWKRPEEHYGSGNFILYEEPEANDITQGKCGNCYFLASLSAIAEYPKRIAQIFKTKEINEAGCYAVEMIINGESRVVVVDDYFPFNPQTGTWAFARPSKTKDRNNEIWVLIVEKAWAKVFGSYQRIEAGMVGEAMYPLTGCASTGFSHDDIVDIDGFWKRLVSADKRKYPMCVSTYSPYDKDVTKKDLSKAGLVDMHCYTLVGAKEITLDNMSIERLIKVRNPYGLKEWTGDWADKSKKWTVRTREQVSGQDKEDGLFFMCLSDFLKFFSKTSICYYQEPRCDNFLVDQLELDEWGATKFTIERDNPKPLVMAIDQISDRLMDRKRDFGPDSYQAAPVKLILTKLNTRIDIDPDSESVPVEQTYISGDYICDQHVALPLHQGLSKGVYMALYKAEFTEAHPERKIVFSVYCQQTVPMQRMSLEDYPAEHIETFVDALRQRKESNLITQYDDQEEY